LADDAGHTIPFVFTPVRQARVSGEIVSQIERAIFAMELSPGDRLQSERELAEQFGVSRITVRDALRVLEARGLIRVKVGATGGAFVEEANTDRVAESISTLIKLKRMTLSELAEARKVVEAATAELAAQRADAAWTFTSSLRVPRATRCSTPPLRHTASCSYQASATCVMRSPAARRSARTRSSSRRCAGETARVRARS
jgi:DNA-binding transcriptional regulator YhcF (GntR family)